MLQCYYHASHNSLLDLETEVGPGKTINMLDTYWNYAQILFSGQPVAKRDRPLLLMEYDNCFRYIALCLC